jgi:hypothetical protein
MSNKTDKILNSLNGIKKAEIPNFFYTRLLGRMQNEMEPVKKLSFLLKPLWVTATLLVLLLINVFSITQLNKKQSTSSTAPTPKPATIESFAEAYNMNSITVYE